jgi:hypothetical protein
VGGNPIHLVVGSHDADGATLLYRLLEGVKLQFRFGIGFVRELKQYPRNPLSGLKCY